jgi:hypothetical protein
VLASSPRTHALDLARPRVSYSASTTNKQTNTEVQVLPTATHNVCTFGILRRSAVKYFGHVSAVMKFFVDGLEVLFPYDYIYKEQHEYMIELKVRVAGLSLVRGGCE